MTFDTLGRTLRVQQGGALEMRLETEESAKRPSQAGDFLMSGAVRIDRALGASPPEVEGLVLEAAGEQAASLKSGPGIRVEEGDVPGTRRVTTGCGRVPDVAATSREMREALEPTIDYPVRRPEVIALARSARGDAKGDRAVLQNTLDFIADYLGDDASPRIMTVEETIRTRKGDCSERAALLVTLLRAGGIPAREVHGLLYTTDLFRSFVGHSWCEVVLDGTWVPVDPTEAQTCVDGTHIRFDAGQKGLTQLVRMMGGLTFRLVSVELRDDAEPQR